MGALSDKFSGCLVAITWPVPQPIEYVLGMELAAEPERPPLGWTERAYASIPISPAMVGVAVAGALVLAFGVSELALGRHLLLREIETNPLAPLALATARTAVWHCLLAAFLPTAYIYMLRGYRRTLDQLRGDLDFSDAEMAQHLARIGRYGPVARGLFCLVSFGITMLMTRLTTPPEFDPWAWNALWNEVRWHRVLNLWSGVWTGLFLLVVTFEGGRFAYLATRVARLDPLDLRGLLPFQNQALRMVLFEVLWVGLTFLTSVESATWDVLLGQWAVSVSLVAAALWFFTLQPLHRLIQDAKRTQLDWCRDALIWERTQLQDGSAERSRIEEIVAYRGVIEGVSAWPYSGMFGRFSLYLLIPLGSWVLGAMVERFIDSLLG